MQSNFLSLSFSGIYKERRACFCLEEWKWRQSWSWNEDGVFAGGWGLWKQSGRKENIPDYGSYSQKMGCHQFLIFLYLQDCHSPQGLKFKSSVSEHRLSLVTHLKLAECDQSLLRVIQDEIRKAYPTATQDVCNVCCYNPGSILRASPGNRRGLGDKEPLK